MITAIVSTIGNVSDAKLWLGGFFLCAALYVVFNLFRKANRTKKGIKLLLIGLLVAEIICDIFWKFCFYPRGEYVNPGLAGIFSLLAWPLLLIAVSGAVNFINRKVTFIWKN